MGRVISFIEDYGWSVIKWIGILFFSVILIVVVIPKVGNRMKKANVANSVVSDIPYSFNDTITMVKYDYSWWDLGGISSTTVTVQKGLEGTRLVVVLPENFSVFSWFSDASGKNYTYAMENYTITQFAFAGNFAITVGSCYQIDYHIIKYGDNHTEVIPLTINQIVK